MWETIMNCMFNEDACPIGKCYPIKEQDILAITSCLCSKIEKIGPSVLNKTKISQDVQEVGLEVP
jgi:hypothetical protein